MSIDDQIALLQQRGMAITDIERAKAALHRIGYYRLSEYWHPMRDTATTTNAQGKAETQVLDTFRVGATFSDALQLYVFDKKLRMLMLDAIERVEVALRVDCAHNLGAADPYMHRDWRKLDRDFIVKDHATWLSRIDNAAYRSREDFVANFLKEYDPPLPLWVSIESWDFGMLSYFVNGLKTQDKTAMAARFGIPRRELLTGWIRAINNVRNVSAHHGRLWNRVLVDRPPPPKVGEEADLDHLAQYTPAHNRLYSAAVALRWFLRTINPTTTWSNRLCGHMQTFPASPLLDLKASGFPVGWENQSLWS